MIVNNPKFEVSAVKPAQYPKNDFPEIVLVGKSNVGKSSFINTMINRKKLARTSSEPGKTRQINFILLICLVMVLVKCLKKNKNKLVILLKNIFSIEDKFH